jgi:acyl carrier protein
MNSNLHERLAQCFAVAFPSLPHSRIEEAAVDSLKNWDSIASQNLLSLVEEEFQITILPEDIPDLTSFDRIEEYLKNRFRKGLPATS